jgi:hypothetical protein
MSSPRFANVVSLLALFIALGGVSYAAITLPKSSVGNKQLKKNAVTSAKVKDRTLLAKDFKAGQLPKGEKGDPGAPGKDGTPGAPGTDGSPGTVAYTRTTIIHPTDDAIANGAKLVAANAAVSDASETKPYLIVLEPGVYDLGSTQLTLKNFVDLQGSGLGRSIVRNNSATASSAVFAVLSRISDLRIDRVIPSGAPGPKKGLSTSNQAVELENVEVFISAIGDTSVEALSSGGTTRVIDSRFQGQSLAGTAIGVIVNSGTTTFTGGTIAGAGFGGANAQNIYGVRAFGGDFIARGTTITADGLDPTDDPWAIEAIQDARVFASRVSATGGADPLVMRDAGGGNVALISGSEMTGGAFGTTRCVSTVYVADAAAVPAACE